MISQLHSTLMEQCSAGKAGQQMHGALLKLLSEPTLKTLQEWVAPPPFSGLRTFAYRHISNLVLKINLKKSVGTEEFPTQVWESGAGKISW